MPIHIPKLLSARYLCLRCWRQIAARDLTLTCDLCDRETDHPLLRYRPRTVKSVLRWRRFFRVNLSKQRCPAHPGLRATLRCICSAPVYETVRIARGDRMLALGVVGTSGAGKTMMMLAALHQMGKAGVEHRLLGIGDTNKRIWELQNRVFNERLKPEKTAEVSQDGFGWRIRGEGMPPSADRLLVMQDLDGNIWTGDAKSKQEEISRYLDLLGKVVLVLDGAQIAADLGLGTGDDWEAAVPGTRGFDDNIVLDYLLNTLGSRTGQMDLALAVSKGDLMWDQPDWTGLRRTATPYNRAVVNPLISEMLIASGRANVVEFAKQFRHTHQFIFSGIGFRPVVQYGSQGMLIRAPDPIGADGPIRWLLEAERA
jgi:hypothetical protein